jgi:hypothetical protein
VLALAAAAVFVACDEQLDSGLACPALCPQLETSVRDTTIFAVELDTSIAGFPALGTELELFIASLGDTLETRGVVRYDSLPDTFRHVNTAEDSVIYAVDTGAVIKLRLAANDTLGGPVTVEVYDVDLNGPDDADPTLAAEAFTPERLLGSRTFAAESLKDSISVPIDPTVLLGKIQSPVPANRLRIGLRVTQSGQARLSTFASNAGGAPLLVFRPSTDTTVAMLRLGPRSKFPAEESIASDFADYLLVTKSPPAPPPGVLRVGGMPGHRAYFRFNIPSSILDSSSVVRATLLLTQRPNPFSPEPNDSTLLQQFAVTSGAAVTDVARALLFLTISTSDSVRLAAADSGVRSFEMIGLVRAWRATTVDRTPRAFALRAATEGHLARQVDFFSNEASVDVRPRLRLTYLPRQPDGLP